MNQNIIASVILAFSFVASGYILSNNQVTTINTPPVNGTLSTTAEGRISVAPDMVVLSLSVYNRASSSKEAYDLTNAGIASLKTLLSEAGVAPADIQTTSIYLNPEYNYTDGAQKPNGFSATHALSVKIRKMADANTILDKVAAINSVQIQSVSYDLDKKDAVYSEARKAALEKARTKADEMAGIASVKIKKVQSISESGNESPVVPYQNAKIMMADTSSASTNLSPGQLEYTINVAVTYELE